MTKLAATMAAIDEDLAGIDTEITEHIAQHQSATNLLSMPGFGPVLGATFLAQVGGSSTRSITSTGLPASPASHPSQETPDASAGTFTGHDASTADCCVPATSPPYQSLKNSPSSRAFNDRERAIGKLHKQALIALARRRMNVIWVILRDHTPYIEAPRERPDHGLTTLLRFPVTRGRRVRGFCWARTRVVVAFGTSV